MAYTFICLNLLNPFRFVYNSSLKKVLFSIVASSGKRFFITMPKNERMDKQADVVKNE